MRWLVPLAALVLAGCGAGTSSSSRANGTPAANQPTVGPASDQRANESLRIPGGQTCLEWLTRLNIRHRALPATRGMRTPVRVTGPIAGVSYVLGGRAEVTADCRLILALDWIGPHLRQFGVTAVRHSGAYVYRRTRSGRPSLHARGLALDVHEFSFSTTHFEVKRHYQRNLDSGCTRSAPTLNQLECRLRGLRLFRELITPDHNADHYDHLHLAIAPLPG
jgi:hypothetical protein